MPLGCTDISMPVSKIFVLLVKESDPLPPGNNVSNISEKCTDIELNDDSILNSISVSTSLMFNNNSFFESCKSSMVDCISSYLRFKESKSSFAR